MNAALQAFTEYVKGVMGKSNPAPQASMGPTGAAQVVPGAPPQLAKPAPNMQDGAVPTAQQQAPAAQNTPIGRVPQFTGSSQTANTVGGVADVMSQLVMNYDMKKSSDEVAKAQSSFNQYQKAVAMGDTQTAEWIAKDGKNIANWKKYLNEYVGMASQGASPQGGSAAVVPGGAPQSGGQPHPSTLGQSGIVTPRDMRPPDPMAAALLDKTKSEAEKNRGEISHWELSDQTEVVKANNDAIAKQAELASAQANLAEKQRLADEAKVMAKGPDGKPHTAQEAKIIKDLADAYKAVKDADKEAKAAGASKLLTQFTVMSTRVKDQFKEATDEYNKLNTSGQKEYDKPYILGMGHKGPDPATDPAVQRAGDRAKRAGRVYSLLNGMQYKITEGEISPESALAKALTGAEMTQDFQPWPTAVDIPDGSSIPGPGNTVLAIAKNGQWVPQ